MKQSTFNQKTEKKSKTTTMEERESEAATSSSKENIELEKLKLRCKSVIHQIQNTLLIINSNNNNNNNTKKKTSSSTSSYQTLLRLALSEFSFLSRSSSFTPLSYNIGHIEAVLYILQQSFVNGVSRVCKPIPVSGFLENGNKYNSKIHVDIACTVGGKPVWFLVSARNPKYVLWDGQNKSLRTRVLEVVDKATTSSPTTRPFSIILFFSNGLSDTVRQKLETEFKASKFVLDVADCDTFSEELDDDWVYLLSKSYQQACAYEIKVDYSLNTIGDDECEVSGSVLGNISSDKACLGQHISVILGSSFCQLISKMRLPQLAVKGDEFVDMINFDTTALIALVSGISNGGARNLVAKSESELRQRFKGNVEFVIAQARSEIQNPIHAYLDGLLSGKKGMICESVVCEFRQLMSMCGGPNEKSRADHILRYLQVVPDAPSERMMSLPTTRKLALKNKIVFGTGDNWKAPTLTANMAFVRAVSQTGMSLFTFEHSPRALTGD